MSNAESVAKAFGKARKSAHGWQCLCPCHEDREASLGITESDNGEVIFNCLAGCDWQEIKRTAENRGLIDRFEDRKKSMQNNSDSQKPKAIVYTYRDENEIEKFQKVRVLPKSFSINRIENEKVIRGLNGQKVPLYNLSAVLKSDVVYITEGEKDADNLIAKSLCATTNIAGGAHWDDSFTEALRNKTIVICQDNDETGRKRTEKIKSHLSGKVKEILLFAPTDLPEKGDVSDWLTFGGIASEIVSSSITIYKAPEKIKALNLADWLEEPIVEPNPILPGIFDSGDKVVIIGQSKTRKSFFAMQLAFCIAAHRRFFEFESTPKKVLMIQFEIRKERYHIRCKNMASGLGLMPVQLQNLIILNARGYGLVKEDLEALIKDQIEIHKPEVVIIDPLYKLIDGDESKSEEIKPILRFFDRLAETSKAAIIYIHHDKKGHAGDQQTVDRGAGSGVLARDFDAAIYLTPHKDKDDHLVIEFLTRNYPSKKAFTAEWSDNHFIYSPLAPDKQTARSAQNKAATIESLADKAKEFIRQQMMMSEAKIASTLFREKLKGQGIPERRVGATIQELIAEGIICEENIRPEAGKPSKFIVYLKMPPVRSLPNSPESEFKESITEFEDEPF